MSCIPIPCEKHVLCPYSEDIKDHKRAIACEISAICSHIVEFVHTAQLHLPLVPTTTQLLYTHQSAEKSLVDSLDQNQEHLSFKHLIEFSRVDIDWNCTARGSVMDTQDCCCEYDYEASLLRCGDTRNRDEASAQRHLPQERHRANEDKNMIIKQESRKPSKIFSIDSILSRPPKLEMNRSRKPETTSLEKCVVEISSAFHRAVRSVSPLRAYGDNELCCSPPSKHRFARPECRSPLCASPPDRVASSPSPVPQRRQECFRLYRRAEFARPLKEFHFERRAIHHEPTMVSLENQGFSSSGCFNCQDCKMAEIRRLQFGTPSIVPCNNGTAALVMSSGRLDADGDGKRSKRKRTIFTTEQLDRLEHEFQHQQYVVGQERKYLAVELGLNEIQVKVWFQNRRIKWRKQKGSRLQPVIAMDMESF
eukprot:gene7826-8675_t